MEKNNLTGLSKQELERLLNLSECAMFTAKKTPGIDIEYANKKFYSMLQYTPQEFEEKFSGSFMGVVLPEEKQRVRALIARQAAAGGILHLEVRVEKKDKTFCWVSVTAQTVETEEGDWYYCSCIDITQQKRALDDVYSAKREAELITNNVPGGVIKVRMTDFMLLYANDGFFSLAGYNRMEYLSLFGNHCQQVIYEEDLPNVNQMVRTALENRGTLSFEYRIVTKKGELRWSYANGCRVDAQEEDPVYLCIVMDITDRKNLQQHLEDTVLRSKNILQFAKRTEWTYRIADKKMYRSGYLVGTLSHEEEIDDFFAEENLRRFVHPDELEDIIERVEEHKKRVFAHRSIYRFRDEKGEYGQYEVSLLSVSTKGDDKPDLFYGETTPVEDNSYMLQQDMRAESALKSGKHILEIARAAQQSEEDDVTGLMPYTDFKVQVEKQLKDRQEEINYGLLCCDIDAFQRFNYHYGISIGNEVLKEMGDILRESVAYQNICSRVSGDYFVAFFTYVRHNELVKKISGMLQKLTQAEAEKSYNLSGITNGIYLIQPEDDDIMQMLERADLARRSIKGTKGNHYAIYTDDLEKSRFWEDEVIGQIEEAIIDHTVEICYLPRIRGTKENVIGCKSVPRVPLKDGNYLQLDDLRHFVDRSKTVSQLVFYVLSGVCKSMSAWKANGKKVLPVSVDITAGQLSMQNAVNKLDEIVRGQNLEPDDIIFEIQEQYFAELTTNFELAIKDLTDRGYRVIISRFASDHMAVQSIRRLPVSGIKFHGEYFNRNFRDQKEQVVLKKIVEMARELGMDVGCGGLQTQLQEDMARAIGCDILEGEIYYGTVQSDVYEKCFLS